MSSLLPSLPEDPAALRAFAAAQIAVLAEQRAQIEALEAELKRELAARDDEIYARDLHIEKLKMRIAVMSRAQFGRSSEKLDQLALSLDDLVEGHAEYVARNHAAMPPSAEAEARREKLRSVRKPLPEHLPRETALHEAACVCPNCGGTKFTQVGADAREVLEYVPSHFKVVKHVRPKMSCRACETILQTPMPSLPIERGIPGPGLLAHVLVSKFCDHLPLYRQSEIYARDGVDIDRSTMAEWVGKMSFLLEPLAEEMARHVRAGEALHADDTPVPVLDPGRGKTKTGRLWVAVRDERPWGSDVPPAVFYSYSPDRKGIRAGELLKGCKGFLHADAYAGFNPLYEIDPKTGAPPLTEVACWAHARRKIYEVHAATGSPAAKELLERIGKLFAIEETVRGKLPDERLKVRQEQAVPLLESLKIQMEAVLGKISGKSTFAGAIRYSLSRWAAFTCYTTDGRLDICNNAAERAIRPLALGRKNWLFAGSDNGGERAAVIYTLIETAKLNGLDPEAYLRDIISRIADHPMKKIAELLPWNSSR
ncbi:MAG: IS66 family transposase [Acidobacteriaceae bacterium]